MPFFAAFAGSPPRQREGVGVLLLKSGSVILYKGEFCEDRMHGLGIQIDDAKCLYKVKYYKDKLIQSTRQKKNVS